MRVREYWVYSGKHFTNYIRWSLVNGAENPRSWFGVVETGYGPQTVYNIDTTRYKAKQLFAPTEVPSDYIEALGMMVKSIRDAWSHVATKDTVLVFVLDECVGSFKEVNGGFLWHISLRTAELSSAGVRELVTSGKTTVSTTEPRVNIRF